MKKIISLLAACTLFAVCLPVSAADAVTEGFCPAAKLGCRTD